VNEVDCRAVESLARFLAWTKCDFDVAEIEAQLDGPRRIAFLSHFGCPFDECFAMPSLSGQSILAKDCIRAMAQRHILNADHFNPFFPLFSNDAMGIETLSTIAAGDPLLSKRLATGLCEPPLVTTDHVELIISGA
jgi:hypothetical protein